MHFSSRSCLSLKANVPIPVTDGGTHLHGVSAVSTSSLLCAQSVISTTFSVGCRRRCFEVACDPTSFSDGFGEWQDRAHVCHDVKKSVVVKIVDR